MSDMPKTMLTAILAEQCKPLIIDEVVLPDKLSYGQVLVRLSYTSICGSQLGEIDGVKGDDPYLPHLLGHEDAEKEITDILEKRGADVVIDNTGNVQVIELAYKLTSPTGKTMRPEK